MVTAIHIIKFIVKLLLVFVLLPVILLWAFVKMCRYRFILLRHLRDAGMPAKQAKKLVKEMGAKSCFVRNG